MSPRFDGLGIVRVQGGHEENGQDCGGRHVSEGLDGDSSKFVDGHCGGMLRNAVQFPSRLGTMGRVAPQIDS